MKFYKRFSKTISVMLSFLMITSCFTFITPSITAFGKDVFYLGHIENSIDGIDEDNVDILTLSGSGTFYGSTGGSGDSGEFVTPDTIASSLSEVSTYLKEQMRNKESKITVYVYTDAAEYQGLSLSGVMLKAPNTLVRDSTGSYEWCDYLKYTWIDLDCSANKKTDKNGRQYWKLNYTFNYYNTLEEEQELDQKIEQIKNSLVRSNDYLTFKAINQYVIDNVVYDTEHVGNNDYKPQYSPYTALIGGTAVCQGYSMLFYRICKALNLGVSIRSGDNHAWNMVKYNGLWYGVDCTWGDGDGQLADPLGWFMQGSTEPNAMYGHVFKNYHNEEAFFKNEDYQQEYQFSENNFSCSHNYGYYYIARDDSGNVIEGIDCTQDGFWRYRYCKYCEQYIDKKGILSGTSHIYEEFITEPTCFSGGYTDYICAVCGNTYRDNYTDPVGHSYKNAFTVSPATCTENEIQDLYCEYGCGNKIQKEKENSALGHDFQYSQSDNKKHTAACSRCDASFSESCVFEKTVVEPTCTENGCSIYTCNKCNQSYSSDVTDAKGHSFGEYIFNNDKTCVFRGTETRTCSVCQATETRDVNDPTFVPQNHSFELLNDAVSATCTDPGYTGTKKCSVCGVEVAGETINPLGHDYVITSARIEPTCVSNGMEESKRCTRCGKDVSGQIIPNLGGHDYSVYVPLSDTTHCKACSRCGKQGSKTYCTFVDNKCVCGNESVSIFGTVVIAEHADGSHPSNIPRKDVKVFVNGQCVCTTDKNGYFIVSDVPKGNYKIELSDPLGDKKIKVLDETVNQTKDLSYLPVNIFDLNNDGTVTVNDLRIYNEYWGQANFGCDINNDGIINDNDYSIMVNYWWESLKEYAVVENENNGSFESANPVFADDLVYAADNSVKNGEKDVDIFKFTMPTVGNFSFDVIPIRARHASLSLNCNWELYDSNGSLVKNGSVNSEKSDKLLLNQGDYYLKLSDFTFDCNSNHTHYYEVKLNTAEHKHSYTYETITQPSCTSEGLQRLTCSCGDTKTEAIKKLEHKQGNAIRENEVPATCTEKGSYTEVFYCTSCGIKMSSSVKTTEKLSHTPVTDKAVAPTRTKTGLTEGKHCSVCGTVLVAQKPVAKLSMKANTLTVTAKKPKVKFAKLKKKNQTIALKKAMTVSNAQGAVTYKLSSAKKGKKSFKKYFKVAKNGKITVKKGLKKGTYKIKIQVTAAGNSEYNASVKTVTVKIKVK